jgi:nucleotide-binding universal stress UspA family protein
MRLLTFRSVLCAVDFSQQSLYALRWAAALVPQQQGRLRVVTALDPLLVHAARTRLRLDLRKDTEPALREFAAAGLPAAASWAPQIDFDVKAGDASAVILETAHQSSADLIVMGTHGLGGFRKLLLGSTTERVLRRTDTPLLAVPLVDPQAVVIDASGPRFNMKAILAATDFSKGETEALTRAADLARQLSVGLVIAHVVTPLAVPSQWQPYVEGIAEESVTEARERLEQVTASLASTVRPEGIVRVGRPAETIASIAEECGAGLIVMGLVGHHGALAPAPGSIAYRVLSLARMPVLVVPAAGS